MNKETIYIDPDDEITNVIDKVTSSSATLISLVLPKRASIFQSTVNMKLLKRKADQAKKKIVLVTAEASLLPLAGGIGFAVARTLNSAPEVPHAFHPNLSVIEADEEDELGLKKEALKELNLQSAAQVPVGQLMAEGQTSLRTKLDDDLDTISLDNTQKEEVKPEEEEKVAKPKKEKKDKLKVPNFKRFKLIMLSIFLIVLLVIGYMVAFIVLPQATVTIGTDSSTVGTNLSFSLATNSTTLNTATNTIPGKEMQLTKSYSATVNATGQQNNGQKATGSVVLTETMCGNVNISSFTSTIPTGTYLYQNSLSYITQNTATFGSLGPGSSGCLSANSNSVNITAQSGGSSYNTSSNSTIFDVPAYDTGSSSSGVTVTGSGGASGGTDQIVTVVSSQDITNAESKINPNSSSIKSSLVSQLTAAGYYPIGITFSASQPSYTPNNQAGIAANSVTVSASITYSMYGVEKSGLNTMLNDNIVSQVGSSQSILSNGINKANFSFTNSSSDPTSLTVQTSAVVGPNINIASLKKSLEGLNINQVKNVVSQNSNVTSISVKFSPFYVSTVPKNTSQININILSPTKHA